MKANFFVLCSPDEILKMLLDVSKKAQWDHGLTSAQMENNVMAVKYGPFSESLTFQFMVNRDKFYIIESASAGYQRVWILDQVQNRPYFMRVVLFAEMTPGYHKARGEGAFFIKSICALKNFIL